MYGTHYKGHFPNGRCTEIRHGRVNNMNKAENDKVI